MSYIRIKRVMKRLDLYNVYEGVNGYNILGYCRKVDCGELGIYWQFVYRYDDDLEKANYIDLDELLLDVQRLWIDLCRKEL